MRLNLQEARLAAGLSQEQAAELIGKTQSHYSKIERGVIGLRAEEAYILCQRLDLELGDLLNKA